MAITKSPEVWLRGPVPGIPALLQPVAHALLQAREEVQELMDGFPAERLWDRPAGVASPGFHLQHLTGVLDRLLTYARDEALTDEQIRMLDTEKEARPDTEGVVRLDTEGVVRPDTERGRREPAVLVEQFSA